MYCMKIIINMTLVSIYMILFLMFIQKGMFISKHAFSNQPKITDKELSVFFKNLIFIKFYIF